MHDLDSQQTYVLAQLDRIADTLRNSTLSTGTEAIKYLFLVNAGGAASVLAFLGSILNKDNGKITVNSLIPLAFFLFGLILLGVYHACKVHFTEHLVKCWNNIITKYDTNTPQAVLLEIAQIKTTRWYFYFFPYGSFISFIAGCAVGLYGLYK